MGWSTLGMGASVSLARTQETQFLNLGFFTLSFYNTCIIVVHFLFYVNTYIVSILISSCNTKFCFRHYMIFKLYYKNQASILKFILVTIFTLVRCRNAVHRRKEMLKSKLKRVTVSKTVTRGDKKVLKAAARLQGRWWVRGLAGNGPSCLLCTPTFLSRVAKSFLQPLLIFKFIL